MTSRNRRGGLEAREVEAAGQRCGHGHFVAHFVGKAFCLGFVCREPVVFAIGQQGQGVFVGFAALVGVGAGHGFGVAVQNVGLLAHVVGVAIRECPRGVDHHLAVLCHGDGVARHGDVAGAADGHAIHKHVHGGFVAAQGVVDGQAIGHAAAVAVDAQVDGVGLQRRQVAHQFTGHHAVFVPAVADVAVDQHLGGLGRLARCHRGRCFDFVPLCHCCALCC